MSAALGFTVDRLQARAELVAGWLENGTLELYDAPRPTANGGAITSQTLLAELTLPASMTVSNGVIAAILTGATIVSDDVVSWGRFKDSAAVIIADADAGGEGSNNALQFNALDFILGASVISITFAIAEQ